MAYRPEDLDQVYVDLGVPVQFTGTPTSTRALVDFVAGVESDGAGIAHDISERTIKLRASTVPAGITAGATAMLDGKKITLTTSLLPFGDGAEVVGHFVPVTARR